MDFKMVSLEQKIKNFKKVQATAEAILAEATLDLNLDVQAIMQENPSVTVVNDLILRLPDKYPGLRRLYEYVIRKEEEKNATSC